MLFTRNKRRVDTLANILELENATKIFGGGLFSSKATLAVDNVSLNIDAANPKITCIAGESGSGKTTIARMLLGLVSPTSGSMLFNGKDPRRMTRAEKRTFRREVQPIFQDPFGVYNPFYKVDRVFQIPIDMFHLADSKQRAKDLIVESLESVGLRPEETLGRYPHQLSGGQRQRVMVARALLLKPRVILADEPVSMVDASLRATILESIRKLNKDLGIALIYITHDLTTAYQVADEIFILYRGSLMESGSVDKVIRSPKHPYTKLLVESIPQMDPDQDWYGGEFEDAESKEMEEVGGGCKFASRCPFVMEPCKTEVPPLYQLDRNCACFLYKDQALSEVR